MWTSRRASPVLWRRIKRARTFQKRVARAAARSANHAALLPRRPVEAISPDDRTPETGPIQIFNKGGRRPLSQRPVRTLRVVLDPPCRPLRQLVRLEAVLHPNHPLPLDRESGQDRRANLNHGIDNRNHLERLPIHEAALEEIDAPPLGWGAVSPTARSPASSAVSAAMTDLPRDTTNRLAWRSPAPSRRSRILIQR